MVKVIMGVKGSGKTKYMVETINDAVNTESGHIVCIERGSKLVYDIKSSVRLVEACDYPIGGYNYLRGFVSGLHAGDYDITHIFIDSLYKISCIDRRKKLYIIICAKQPLIAILHDQQFCSYIAE